ncbi:RNAPII degradation factor [Ascosphaera acerosa]|nr:RNAPII degradation factor [Ascosphaera acerosa]
MSEPQARPRGGGRGGRGGHSSTSIPTGPRAAARQQQASSSSSPAAAASSSNRVQSISADSSSSHYHSKSQSHTSRTAGPPAAGSEGKLETRSDEDLDDDDAAGIMSQLKKKHATGLATLKELFPDWSDEDLLSALEDAAGDLELVVERITEGTISQWETSNTKNMPMAHHVPAEHA